MGIAAVELRRIGTNLFSFFFFCLSTVQSSIPMTNIIGARMVGYLLALVSVMFA